MIGKDFIAELQFLPTNEGGRKGYAFSGYRPVTQFDNYPEYRTTGQQIYIGRDRVNPGEKVMAEISIVAVEYFSKRLYQGMKFKFSEGLKAVGKGKILSVLNNGLKSDPNVEEKSINLNLYPKDIKERVLQDFNTDYSFAFSRLQELLISDKKYQNSRLIRAIIYLSNKDIDLGIC